VKTWKIIMGLLIVFVVAALLGFWLWPKSTGSTGPALDLSVVVLVGFAAIVVLIGALVFVFQVIGLARPEYPLALPEGSIRALIAFSLLVIFVCLAAFLYVGTSTVDVGPGGKTVMNITGAQLDELKSQFIVAYEPAKDDKGNPLYEPKSATPAGTGAAAPGTTPPTGSAPSGGGGATPPPTGGTTPPTGGGSPPPTGGGGAPPTSGATITPRTLLPGGTADTTKPLYNATYFSKRSKEADDFAKQIFTTLATVFVSVISFYFGSSVTTAGVGAGAAAAGKGPGGGTGGTTPGPKTQLDEAKASAHDAQLAADQTTVSLTAAQSAKVPDSLDAGVKQQISANIASIQDLAKQANAAAQAANSLVVAATTAANMLSSATDPGKVKSANDDLTKAHDEAKTQADNAKALASKAADLLKKINDATKSS
jgi:hypothetical protein